MLTALGIATAVPYLRPTTAVAPPPVSGVLSHTLLQIGMTAPG